MTGNMEDLQHDANHCLQDQDQGGRSSQTTSLQKFFGLMKARFTFTIDLEKKSIKTKRMHGHVRLLTATSVANDVTADRMNPEACCAIFPAWIQSNAAKMFRWCFTVQMDEDPKHTAQETQEFLKAKEQDILQ